MSTSYARSDALAGKVAIVTGAAQGIGRGITQALTDRGAAVLLVDLNAENLATTVEALEKAGRQVGSLVADVRERDAPGQIGQAAGDRFARLDGLVTNAIARRPPGP